MRKLTKKTAVIVAGSTLLVAVGGGIAFAYWTSSGTGTGSATTSAGTTGLTVSPSATSPTDLAPGVAPEALTGTITNGAANSAHVTSLTVTITGVTGGTGCTAADYGLTNGTSAALTKGGTTVQTITVPVNTELASGAQTNFPSVDIGFANDPANSQDGCKGALPQLTFTAN